MVLENRVIPCLLIKNRGLFKTINFKNPSYLGDPMNITKIFNSKEVDELVILDIQASKKGSCPDFDFLQDISSECFMPLSYGGGIKTIKDISKLISIGIDKVIINNHATKDISFIEKVVEEFGSSTVVGSIDIKKSFFGAYKVFDHVTKKNTSLNPVEFSKLLADYGIGELLINSVDNDGIMKGYDLSIIKEISESVNIPVIACGGAGTLDDIKKVIKYAGVAAAAAGSLFVYNGIHKAVLINYPKYNDLVKLLK